MEFLFRVNQLISKHAFASAVLLVLAAFAFSLLFFDIHYQTNDDVGMMLWLRGISIVEKPTVNILFMNIIYASLLKTLYLWTDKIDWYPLFFLIIVFTSYAYLSYIVIKYVTSIYIRILYLIAFTGTFILPIVSLQFTIVAGIAGAAGAFGLLVAEKNVGEKIFASLLLIISSLIRHESFQLILVMFLPVYVYKLYLYWRKNNSKVSSLFLPIHLKYNDWLIYIIVILFLNTGLNYYSINEYGSYYQFNVKRGKIHDYQVLEKVDLQTKAQILAQLGWSENDYYMLGTWFFLNDKLYNVENFDKAIQYIPRTKIYQILYFIFNSKNLQAVKKWLFETPLNVFLLFLYAAFIFHRLCWMNIGMMLFSIIYFVLVYLLIAFFLRVPPLRVYIVMYIAMCLLPFATMNSYAIADDKSLIASNKVKFLLKIALLSTAFYTASIAYKDIQKEILLYRTTSFTKPLSTAVNEFCKTYPNAKLLVSWGEAFPFEAIRPFEDISYMKKIKIFSLGTSQQSKEAKELLASLAISDLYVAIAERNDVFLLLFNSLKLQELNLYKKYMMDHYQKKIEIKILPNPFEGIKNTTLAKPYVSN